jgi:uncharacterized radical SAM superfamily Fe-S cluster-containing enzyme
MIAALQKRMVRRRADQPWDRKATQSLCPECLQALEAELRREDGRIFMYKTCPFHGEFRELISADADFFQRLEQLSGRPTTDRQADLMPQVDGCPQHCGLCTGHKGVAMLVNIDLTDRCNMHCPVCFAGTPKGGHYVLSRDTIRGMLTRVAANRPTRPSAIQYSGGEPTLHPEFVEIVDETRQFGFAQVQVASNGLRFAKEPDFARRCANAGLHVVYLQFDGTDDAIHLKTRGAKLFEMKQRAIENIGRAGIWVCLVPTIAKGVNDHHVGNIFRFAIEHADTITAIAWQPVSFTGRFDYAERLRQRYTLADLAEGLEQQTGVLLKWRDWYPYSFVAPFARLVKALTERPANPMNCHEHCGMATYVVVNTRTRQLATLPQLLDVEPVMTLFGRTAKRIEQFPWTKSWHLAKLVRQLRRHYHPEYDPEGWSFDHLAGFIDSYVDFSGKRAETRRRPGDRGAEPCDVMMLAAMHFQDVYNFELPRVQHCAIHYAGADGRTYPFCTYNVGPYYRQRVEAGVPNDSQDASA